MIQSSEAERLYCDWKHRNALRLRNAATVSGVTTKNIKKISPRNQWDMSRVISMKDVLIVLKMDFSAMCSKCARFGDSSIYRLVYQGIQTNRPDGTHYGPSNISIIRGIVQHSISSRFLVIYINNIRLILYYIYRQYIVLL